MAVSSGGKGFCSGLFFVSEEDFSVDCGSAEDFLGSFFRQSFFRCPLRLHRKHPVFWEASLTVAALSLFGDAVPAAFPSMSSSSNAGFENVSLSSSTSVTLLSMVRSAGAALFDLFKDVVSAVFPFRSCFVFRWAFRLSFSRVVFSSRFPAWSFIVSSVPSILKEIFFVKNLLIFQPKKSHPLLTPCNASILR